MLYEYRAYNPTLGRWISRDPITEIGFKAIRYNHKLSGFDEDKNIYVFVRNDMLKWTDPLGLSGKPPIPPNNHPPDGYDKCCCTMEKIIEGKQELIARFSEAKELLDNWGVKRDPEGERGVSCFDSNNAILQ